MVNIFLSSLQCEKTKECLNDIKEKLREAFTKASELIAALGGERLLELSALNMLSNVTFFHCLIVFIISALDFQSSSLGSSPGSLC